MSNLQLIEASDLNTPGVFKINNCPLGPDAAVSLLIAAGRRIVESRNGFYSFVSNDYDAANPVPVRGFLDFHTDGLYSKRIPDYVVFYCDQRGTHDCPTIFADTRVVIEEIRRRGLFETYRQLQITYNFDESEITLPLISDHPISGQPVLHIAANYARHKHHATEEAIHEVYEIMEKAIVREHSWREGDLILFDNHVFVHRRKACVSDSNRKLIRLWLRCSE